MPQDSLAAEGKVCCSTSAVAAQLHLCAYSYAVTYSDQKLAWAMTGRNASVCEPYNVHCTPCLLPNSSLQSLTPPGPYTCAVEANL